MFKKPIVATAILLFTACASTDDLQPGTGGQTFEIRGHSYEDIWRAAVRTISRNMVLVESNQEKGTLKAEVKPGVATWGEVVGVFIQPPRPGAERYVVEVQSLKRSRLQVSGQDWTAHVIEGMRSELKP